MPAASWTATLTANLIFLPLLTLRTSWRPFLESVTFTVVELFGVSFLKAFLPTAFLPILARTVPEHAWIAVRAQRTPIISVLPLASLALPIVTSLRGPGVASDGWPGGAGLLGGAPPGQERRRSRSVTGGGMLRTGDSAAQSPRCALTT